jgi:uncharacterized protein YbgA (DUF1722 family)/uncharacterized protein YbbK (DUF523 family)
MEEIHSTGDWSGTVTELIRIGISGCLLGQNVRFDGGNKCDRYIRDTLGQYFQWVPVCPEVEAGLGVPRPTLRFENIDGEARIIQAGTAVDVTEVLKTFSEKRVRELKKLNLFGYLLKSKSPSCGKGGIRIYAGYGIRPVTTGIGVFARELAAALPNLPIEDEGRLSDPGLRENWVNRVFAYHRFRTELLPRPTMGKLVKFHSRYKFIILAHCPETYRAMGRLVGTGKTVDVHGLVDSYETMLMSALKKRASVAKHVNVLQHIFGFFKRQLSAEVRRDLLQTIEDYQRGMLPLIVPIALIRHYAHLLKIDYLCDQTYLVPHPKELALRV